MTLHKRQLLFRTQFYLFNCMVAHRDTKIMLSNRVPRPTREVSLWYGPP